MFQKMQNKVNNEIKMISSERILTNKLNGII